ncbi:MAG: TerB family tellurite resistance protein [Pyrinomonadaceae bacterium]|nr:TerB family tellurite resistance protein [Pyrinomonadaceae bacterium]
MNLVKDAFVILYFLASTDGNIDPQEMAVIAEFITLQHGKIDFNPSQTILDLGMLSGDGRIKEYDRALHGFKNASTAQDRLTMLDFATNLARADGVIAEGEKILFQDMAQVWGIDLQKYAQPAAAAVSAPAVAPVAANDTETNRACYQAWLLGSAYSTYLSKVPLLGSALCQADFEAAKAAADVIGLTFKPFQSLDVGGLPVSFGEMMAGNFFREESLSLVEQMDGRYLSKKVSSYFLIIAKCNLTLAPIADAHEAESVLNEILRLSIHTEIPDESIEELVSTVRHGVRNFSAFEDSVTKFLYNRMNGEKNSVEQNVFRENDQTNEFKSAAQTAAEQSPTSTTTCAFIQTLLASKQQRADDSEVMRSMINHRGWFVPLEMFYRKGEKKIRIEKMMVISTERHIKAGELWLFTDFESVLRAQAANAQIGSYGGVMSGTELFGKIPADIQAIHINPCSPTEQRWSFFEVPSSDTPSIELARCWSDIIVLEEKIAQWQPGKPDLKAIADFRGFITFTDSSNEYVFFKECNQGMRIAAPIFTFLDSADKFLASLPPEKRSTLKQIIIDGQTLLNEYPKIQIKMPDNQPPASFDGAVINAFGPGAFYELRFSDLLSGT